MRSDYARAELLIRVTAMPADTNPYGGVFGGWLMSATGSFDHHAIDGADGARLMKGFKALVESPLGLVA